MTNLKSLIYNNPIIIKSLFHLQNPIFNIINDNKRTFIKPYNTSFISHYLPVIIPFIPKELKFINFIVHETYNPTINQFTYSISLQENELSRDFKHLSLIKFNIHLSQYNNIINCHTSVSQEPSIYIPNPFQQSISFIILNYLEHQHTHYIKNDILLKEIKPIIENLNHHSFVLNIT